MDSQGRSVRLPGVDRTDILYGTNAPGTLVAVAWPAKPRKPPEKVRVAVYRIGEQAELIGSVRETNCAGTVQQVRLSALGRAATLDCNPSGEDQDQPLWDVVRLADDAEQELLVPLPDLEGQRGLTNALYFGSPGMKGHAVLNDGGKLETVSDSDSKREFHSNILRVVGRPDNIAFHSSHGFAALGAFDAPLVLVHEDSTGTGGRDDIYAVPEGLGDASEVDYSPNGKCIEVRTKNKGNVLAYHIVLDPTLLAEVARGLAGSTPTYKARALCGFT